MSDMQGYRRTVPYAQGYSGGAVVARFMNGVYAWMCVGLLLTAIVGWMTAHNQGLMQFVAGSFILLVIAELGLVFVLSAMIQRLNPVIATGLFATYAALNGLTLSGVFLRYDLPTIGSAFLITGGMFGAMSLIGYVTKKDLSGLGMLCLMALIGILLATIVNIFWASETLYWVVTYAGVLIFAGLTAYDTQKLKGMALATAGDEVMASRMSIYGSLALYLDFINLLLFILRILGGSKRR